MHKCFIFIGIPLKSAERFSNYTVLVIASNAALLLGRPSEASQLCTSVLLDPGGILCGKNTPRKLFGNTLFLHQSFGRNAVYKMIHIL
jgi:hypothetical protein